MSKSDCSKLHIALFPWFAFGHFIPYIHLSNKLAQKGHKVSFLLPKGIQPKLEHLNQYPHLIRFFPLVLSHVDGLPPGAESTSNVPLELQKYLAIALDQTRDQVEAVLKVTKPDMVFCDFGHWIPALARQIGIKSICYEVVSSMPCGLAGRKIAKEMSVDELIQLPPGYPSSKVRIKAEEVAALLFIAEDFGIGLSFQDRIRTCVKERDAIAFRTYREIEGPFCDYVAQRFGKSVLLSGPCLPETQTQQLEDKWANWLNKFEPSSVVFCSFGSQSMLEKDEFQELLLGFELSGLPFLVALKPPQGCLTIEEALPEGFQERVRGRGLVHGGWVPQELLLRHPSIGCFVNHCGYGTMWEFLFSDCQIVLIPEIPDQILNTRLMVEELRIAVEVERGKNRQIPKESLSKAIKLVMDKDNEMASLLKRNHAKLKQLLSNRDLQEEYINNFIRDLQNLLK
ncbi:UDP-glycosyltransferase 79B6-like [Durio zibethinus]|uniref:UDP-glycosyltransferase 79B6-like n=1 Tax=Durio zibethinus TaxID=66656 RepID=A0A6P5WPS2_DURZI|nr:UDP-glycosyltransferase 79B6-like [Durio zibethinus]